MTATRRSALADYAARRWMSAYRTVSRCPFPIEIQTPDQIEADRCDRIRCRERADSIRAAVGRGAFTVAIDLMAAEISFGLHIVCFLERAFPLMTASERTDSLRYVWCRFKGGRIPVPRALRLFREVPSLCKTVPSTWGAEIRLYRGARRHDSSTNPWQNAKRGVRRGIAWTTDRSTALKFASGIPRHVGCIGTAIVPRSSILAYFMDPDTLQIGGKTYPVDGYHEHECIIDPTACERISYERVETPKEL